MKINFFWSGKTLSKLNLACIQSWKEHYPNSEIIIWTYSKITNPPQGVTLRFGDKIVPRKKWFAYKQGHSKGTPVAFSNLFRAELLSRFGGLYVDTDVLCREYVDFNELPDNVYLSSENHRDDDFSIATCVIWSRYPEESIFRLWKQRIKELVKTKKDLQHGDLGPKLLSDIYVELNRPFMVWDSNHYNPIDWMDVKDNRDLFQKKSIYVNSKGSNGVHLFQSLWKEEDYEKIFV